ncbi:uncharacterized protein LOC119414295 [Nematolebias whitei]|uniref:uncharacterized protein LOC119414295 n=1 Tax=Nematolebias whitei TaxID=451745 RepID=UPI001899074D|nr:uncharacterized protein LOC119414295 [Nematolebias whitei]
MSAEAASRTPMSDEAASRTPMSAETASRTPMLAEAASRTPMSAEAVSRTPMPAATVPRTTMPSATVPRTPMPVKRPPGPPCRPKRFPGPPCRPKQPPGHPSLCEHPIGNLNAAEHYQVIDDGGMYVCVTRCHKQYPGGPKTCKNKGKCKVYIGLGVVCECQNVNSTWYLGHDCHLPIQKTAFFAGLSVTLAVFIVMIGALTANTFINKHNQKKKKDIKENLVNQWMNEDYQWSRNNTQGNGFKGNFINPAFPEKDPTIYIGNSFQQHFGHSAGSFPHPQSLDKYDMAFTNPGYPQLPTQRDFSDNLPMRTVRPQIRTSWDI